jgi:hypothetical protein
MLLLATMSGRKIAKTKKSARIRSNETEISCGGRESASLAEKAL